MLELTTVQQIAIWILPVLFALTGHEAAHGFVSYRLGDNTAKLLGRLTFNPIKHIDPIGTVLVPLLMLALSNFTLVFGWAKPVPINPNQFKNKRRDMALAVAAGPCANFVMAFFWALLFKLGLILDPVHSTLALFLVLSARAGIMVNFVLAFLNLLPIPPLDGSKILSCFLSASQAYYYEKIAPYGFVILLVLIYTNILNILIATPVNWSIRFVSALFNL